MLYLKDGFGRKINYLRLSITDRCNFKCIYCFDDKYNKNKTDLSLNDIIKIVRASVNCGINKIRLTGGEPLIREDIINICQNIKKINGVEELSITTNGYNLMNLLKPLKESGLDRINLSIDSLKSDVISKIAFANSNLSVNYPQLIDSINKCGFKNLKINTVLLKGYNTDEIKDFVELTHYNNLTVRFIELMPIGPSIDLFKTCFIDSTCVLKVCSELKPLGMDGVSSLYKMDSYMGNVGLISPVSDKFCRFCNRIRITSDAKIKTCLHGSSEVSILGLSEKAIEETIKKEVLNKPYSHNLDLKKKSNSVRPMVSIGG